MTIHIKKLSDLTVTSRKNTAINSHADTFTQLLLSNGIKERNMETWQDYVEHLTSFGKVTQAAIVGLDGTIWAQSPELNISSDEISQSLAGFKDDSILLAAGIHINGVKYMYRRPYENQIQFKYQETGVHIAKTTTCIIIGTYIAGMEPIHTQVEISRTQELLLEAGY